MSNSDFLFFSLSLLYYYVESHLSPASNLKLITNHFPYSTIQLFNFRYRFAYGWIHFVDIIIVSWGALTLHKCVIVSCSFFSSVTFTFGGLNDAIYFDAMNVSFVCEFAVVAWIDLDYAFSISYCYLEFVLIFFFFFFSFLSPQFLLHILMLFFPFRF